MILSNRQAHYLIQHLEQEVKQLTADRDAKAERIKELERQIAVRDVAFQNMYREFFL